MSLTKFCPVAVVLLAACGGESKPNESKSKADDKPVTSPSEANAKSKNAEPKPPARADRPSCELVKDGGKPEKAPQHFASAHWGKPSERPFTLSCGSFDFVSSGGIEDFPMKARTIKIDPNGGPGTIWTQLRIKDGVGEMKLEVWDAQRIKGTFSVKGKGTMGGDVDKEITVEGSFDIKS